MKSMIGSASPRRHGSTPSPPHSWSWRLKSRATTMSRRGAPRRRALCIALVSRSIVVSSATALPPSKYTDATSTDLSGSRNSKICRWHAHLFALDVPAKHASHRPPPVVSFARKNGRPPLVSHRRRQHLPVHLKDMRLADYQRLASIQATQGSSLPVPMLHHSPSRTTMSNRFNT